jgi:hypothetical protein
MVIELGQVRGKCLYYLHISFTNVGVIKSWLLNITYNYDAKNLIETSHFLGEGWDAREIWVLNEF